MAGAAVLVRPALGLVVALEGGEAEGSPLVDLGPLLLAPQPGLGHRPLVALVRLEDGAVALRDVVGGEMLLHRPRLAVDLPERQVTSGDLLTRNRAEDEQDRHPQNEADQRGGTGPDAEQRRGVRLVHESRGQKPTQRGEQGQPQQEQDGVGPVAVEEAGQGRPPETPDERLGLADVVVEFARLKPLPRRPEVRRFAPGERVLPAQQEGVGLGLEAGEFFHASLELDVVVAEAPSARCRVASSVAWSIHRLA